ncbi:MAG: glycosyltransferase family 4 protein [Candidatus Erginobacter occultus]|nr:glycosyltransferase family 4 protein [Candidatus Erginobacter occultus]
MPENRPNILFLSDHLGHGGSRIHGATSYFLSVLPRLRRAGFPLTVCFLRNRHPAAALLERQGVKPLFLNRPRWDLAVTVTLIRLIRKQRIDLVHTAGMKGILTGRAAARATGRKCVIHLHDMLPQSAPIRILQRSMASWTDRALVISDAVGEFAREHFGIPARRIVTLYNGIDLRPYAVERSAEEKNSLKSSLGLPPDAPVIVTVGRIDSVKQQSQAILAMRSVAAAVPRARLLIVGDGPKKEEWSRLAEERGSPVIFTGQREDIPELLAISDLMVITSSSEGLSLAAIEALAAGVPVVCPRIGGLPEVVEDNRSGILTTPGRPQEIEAALIRLLQDSSLRGSFSRAARSRALSFDIRTHIKKLERIYFSVMAEI